MMFIIGPSGSGKSTLARKLQSEANTLGHQTVIISAGQWIRDLTGIQTHDQDSINKLTEASKEELAKNPYVARNWIRNKIFEYTIFNGLDAIIEGVRNPLDFWSLFDPEKDTLVILAGTPATEFEETGLTIIKNQLEELIVNNFLPESARPVYVQAPVCSGGMEELVRRLCT